MYGTTEVSYSLTIYWWLFAGDKMHAYLAKTRVGTGRDELSSSHWRP